MELIEANPQEYERIFSSPYVAFNSARFNGLNAHKCDAVKYLVFQEGKPQLGLIAGLSGGELSSPFSAPFGGFSLAAKTCQMSTYLDAAHLLGQYAAQIGAGAVQITLPPAIYNETFIAKQAGALLNAGFNLQVMNLNSYFNLSDFDEAYFERIPHAAKKNYNTAVRNGLSFLRVSQVEDRQLCYQILKNNREEKGRQLRMTFEEILSTAEIIPVDFFLVSDQEGAGAAAAIVYHVTSRVAQVIYWGGLRDKESLRPSNFLAYHIWEYYKGLRFQIVDIGPSSQNSIPDPGLVNFKESLGCKLALKLSFRKQISDHVLP